MTASPFLSIPFKPLIPDDRPTLENFLQRHPNRLSGYTFSSLIAWNEVDHYTWAFLSPETLLISQLVEGDSRRHLIQPEGALSKDEEDRLLMEIQQLGYPLKLIGVSSEFLRKHHAFCSHFDDLDDRTAANYVYRTSDLAFLEGRRYAKKRNLIAQAEELYRWTLHPLTADHSDDCRQILAAIEAADHPAPTSNLTRELTVLNYMLDHYEDLEQQGCLITIDDQPAAFSIYEGITPRMAAVHFEKAERHYKGLYQLINRETAKAIATKGFLLINREEDLGSEGLRQAKASYHPVGLAHFHTLTYKN